MTYKNVISCLIGILIGSCLGLGIIISQNSKETKAYNAWKLKEKELTLKVDSLKHINDTLLLQINNSDTDINNIENEYEKNCSIMGTKSFDEQSKFFSDYLRQYHNNN